MAELGALSKRPDVRDWVMQIPKCQTCGSFVGLRFSGLAHDFVWPVCSNGTCEFGKYSHTFHRPDAQKGQWQCRRGVLALWAMLRKRMRLPRDLVVMICRMVWTSRTDDAWK